EIWTMSDVARTNIAYFAPSPVTGGTPVLDHIDTTSFNGQTARYGFTTVLSTSIPPGTGDNTGRGYVPVPLLTAITPPTGNAYKMQQNGQPAYDPPTATPGGLTRLTLPTLGSIGWTYDVVPFAGLVTPTPKRSPAVDRPSYVKTRAKYDQLGA